MVASSLSPVLVSKCTIFPDKNTNHGDMKLSISDLPMSTNGEPQRDAHGDRRAIEVAKREHPRVALPVLHQTTHHFVVVGLNSQLRLLRRNDIFLAVWSKAREHKRRTLAFLIILLEAISFVLDLYRRKEWGFLSVSFLLSVIGFLITVYNYRYIKITRFHEVENQFIMVEFAFSVIQLIVMCVHLLMKILHVNMNINASVFPLVLAISVFIFTLKMEAKDPSPESLRAKAASSDSLSTTTTMRSETSQEGKNSSLNFPSTGGITNFDHDVTTTPIMDVEMGLPSIP